jgi:hypothetical protein
MSVKVRVQVHPFKKEYTDFYCDAAPLSDLYAQLNVPLDITHARFLIDDEIVPDAGSIPPDGSTVSINVVPEGNAEDVGKGGFWLGALLTVAGIAVTVATFGTGGFLGGALIGTGVSMMAGGVVLMNREIPLGRDTGTQLESIRGSKNRERKLECVPVLFGRHLVTPDVAALPYTEIDAAGQQWLIQLFCAGYNDMQVERDTLKVGDTALTDLSETKTIGAILAGTDKQVNLEIMQNGEASALYPRLCVEQQFNTVLKHSDSDGNLVDLTRTTADKTTRINVDLFFPMGLIRYDDKNKEKPASVSVSIQYKREGDAAYTSFPGWNQNISATTVDMFRRQATVSGLTPGKYTVRITRVTADSSNSQTIDTVYAGSLRAYADDRPVRREAAENLTLIALKIRASALASGVIDNFNFVAQSIVPDYSPADSTWIPRLTKNPASMLLYALRGKLNPDPAADTDIDWDSFREFWIFCNQKGYTCNAVQSGRELFSVLCAKIAKTGRASVLRVNGAFSVIIDKERPAPVQLFSPRNTTGYGQTIVKADIPDEIAIEFIDETAGWASNERSVFNTPDGLPAGNEKTKQSSRIWGITDPAVIFKFARYQYACIKNRPIIHTLECDIEYLVCKKGDLIEYAGDTALTGIAYGKVTGLIRDGTQVVGIATDTLFPQEAGKNYGVRCRKSNGLLITLDVINRQTNDKAVFFEAPQDETTLEEGDLVIFGLTGKITRQLVITEITPADNFRATLKCVDYAPEIFNVDDPAYVVPPFDNKITTEGSIIDKGITNPDEWQTWFTYHDDTEKPEKPTGSGTSGGWHRYPTPQSRWVSQKTARNVTDGEWSAPVQTSYQIINKIVAERPTYTEIVEGFTAAGVTIVPNVPELAAAGGFRFISLSWAKQTYLSNLKEYQLQVSEDAVDWYALRFDGVDWKGEKDAVFPTINTMVIHPNIPPAGTEEEPAGRFLYYRVRQRTMLDDYSDWSAVAGAETKLADTGDYGVNTISANALKIAEIFALFAHIGETLIIDPAYGISSEERTWAQGDTRAVLNSREISFQYFLNQVWQIMARFGPEGLETPQVFAAEKFFLTNDDMRGRRNKGFDIGAPYLSGSSRVVHYDVSMLDQYGQELFTMSGSGALAGDAEGVALALKATAPYATEARALYGNFRLRADIGISTLFTVDFWILYKWNEEQILFDIGNDAERIRIEVINDEPYINDLPSDGVWINDHPTDGVWANEIQMAHTRMGHFLNGIWNYIILEDFAVDKWYHVGVIHTADFLQVAINNQVFPFGSQEVVDPIAVDINPTQGQIDGENSLMVIDEVLIDPTVAESLPVFYQNTVMRRPWGKLDDQYPWFILNVKDPDYFKTNIFQSPDFAAAVQKIINGGA